MNVDLTEPWDLADVIFVIEDKKLYVNKPTLMMSSDVFKTMFTADFREKDLAEILLPGKNYDAFLLLMKVIHPPNMEVNGTNVQQLLPLSHEYGVHHVTSVCEKVLLTEPPSVQNLVLADRYSLLRLREACLTYTQHTPLTQLEAQPGFDELQPDTVIEVLRHKVLQTELGQKTEDPEPEPQPKAARPEVEPSKEFIYELMSKPPSVENLLLGEKYNVPPVIQACVKYAKDKPLSEIKAEPGYDKITPATLVDILNHEVEVLNNKVINMEPQVNKLRKLETELKSAEAILAQVASLEKNQKQSQTVCSELQPRRHTAGSHFTYIGQDQCRYSCSSCKKSVMEDIRNICVPVLQRLNNIKG